MYMQVSDCTEVLSGPSRATYMVYVPAMAWN